MGSFVKSLFFPHKGNNHHAYLLRTPALFVITLALGISLLLYKLPGSLGSRNILGFSTSINKDQIIKLTNKERSAQGFTTLSSNPLLDQAAQLKAQDMIAKNYWAHTAPNGITPWYFFDKAGYQYSYAGENLAMNFDSSGQVMTAWMSSPSHKENILNSKYSEIGIAIVNGKLQGEDTTLVVQLFGAPTGVPAQAYSTPSSQTLPRPFQAQSAITEVIAANNSQLKTQQAQANKVKGISFDQSFKQALNAPLPQKFILITLIFILNMFLIDKLVLSANRIQRLHTGHANYHIITITILLLAAALLTKGVIL